MAKWDSLWLNVNLATLDDEEGYAICENAAIASYQGVIIWLGPQAQLPGEPDTLAQRVVDLNGAWVTPGLIDCHTHIVYAGSRASEFNLRLQGSSYAEIAARGGGILATVNATRDASFNDLLKASMQRLTTMREHGVTTLEIKSGYGLNESTEEKMLRVIAHIKQHIPITVKATFLGAHVVPTEFKHNPDAYVEELCEIMLPKFHEAGWIDFIDVFSENIAFNLQQTKKIFTTAVALGVPIKCHAEQLSAFGAAKLAAEFNAISVDHLEYLDEATISSLKSSATTAVLLPSAYYFLRQTHKPAIDLLRKHKIPMAVASDSNPGTSPISSVLMSLNFACVLFGLTPQEALRGATVHAASALGLSDTHGVLRKGMRADMAIWKITHPDELAYHIGYNPCIGTIVGGEMECC